MVTDLLVGLAVLVGLALYGFASVVGNEHNVRWRGLLKLRSPVEGPLRMDALIGHGLLLVTAVAIPVVLVWLGLSLVFDW